MKKFAIVTRYDEVSKKLGQRVKVLLAGKFIYDEENPDLVLSIGGDGTMLGAVHQYLLKNPKYIGIHTGTLGFFTDYSVSEIDELVEAILTQQPNDHLRSILEVTVRRNGTEEILYALNEMRLDHGFITQVMKIYIDDELLENFRGNGVCISTPSGSTAYNKSVGGAVVISRTPLMQLTEIASISNNVYRSLNSPLILDASRSIVLKEFNRDHVYLATDNQSYKFDNVESITIRISDKKANFINFKEKSYINRIRKAFISEVDN